MALHLLIFKFVRNIQWAVFCCGTGRRGSLRETPSSGRTTHFQDTWRAVVLEVCTKAFQKAGDCTAYCLRWSFVIYQGRGRSVALPKRPSKILPIFPSKICKHHIPPHFPWKDVEEYCCFNDLFENCLFLSSWHWTICRHTEELSFTDFYTQELQLAIETSKNKQKKWVFLSASSLGPEEHQKADFWWVFTITNVQYNIQISSGIFNEEFFYRTILLTLSHKTLNSKQITVLMKISYKRNWKPFPLPQP